MVARSLLEAEGIPCSTQGEESQRVIGAAPLRLRVPVGDEEEARALLAHLEPIAPSDE
jgi:putative signal transducing protein